MEIIFPCKKICATQSGKKIDEDMIGLLQEGDVAAFEIIYNEYNKKLFGFIYKILKSEADSRGITQEVFITFWENRRRITAYSMINSFLFTIAYNRSIDRIRKKINERKYITHIKSVQLPAKNKTEDDYNFMELKDRLEAIVEELPPKRREVFRLSRNFSLTNREIADRLKITVSTVENHMSKALNHLRNKLPG